MKRPPPALEPLFDELYAEMAKAGPGGEMDPQLRQVADQLVAASKLAASRFHGRLSTQTGLGRNVEATYWRAVRTAWQKVPLSTAGSQRTSGRYHRPPDPTLYLCERPETAVAEVRMFSIPRPYTLFPVHIRLGRVLDLTDPEVLAATEVDAPAMLQPWEILNDLFAAEAYSQLIAKTARLGLFEGLIVESVPARGHKNLVVFTDNLRTSSSLKVDVQALDRDALEIDPHDQTIQGKLEES